ncbi:hypothetical protein MXD81_59300 [Microbacteriaceae bacterium K1510]|nr:hypothetical protein [Microbacteriaceae bacterium K1510]
MELAARTFLRVPVIGWLLRDAIYGLPDAKYYFIGNLFLVFAALVYLFGYPFFICSVLAATAAYLTFLVVFTTSDLFDSKSNAQRQAAAARRDEALRPRAPSQH